MTIRPLSPLLLLFALSIPAHAAPLKISAAQMQALGIETAQLAKTGSTAEEFPAKVMLPNSQMYVVSSPLAGYIEQMIASSNQPVKKGQILARVQAPGLAEIERGFLQAETQQQLARDNFVRDQKLYDQGIIAHSRFLATQSRYVEANAMLQERQQLLKLSGFSDANIKALKSSGNLTATLAIASPIDGVVLEQLAVSGQRVDVATPLYHVAKLAPLWLEIQVPAAKLSGLREGMSVSVPSMGATGKITSIGRSVNPASQSALVRALMVTHLDNLRPGLQVEAAIEGSRSDLTQVRNSALIRDRGKTFVFVKTDSGFEMRPVKIESEGASSSLTSGLKGDETIAVRGVAALKAAAIGEQ